ncbi:TonB-dependent receptor plug domain-containing protein [Corallococcus aberystwythensis]|uniref:TonB-dependent receptor n=1 Tax=Corallococcus aberystwythensis TaxID=2316722 RepID=A0A3A8Q8R6_9BACT|nr:TonB-dependent receptor [Corallococcus aberystwythensis]RKH59664.1 TonB-dependent receptor [Corallococcus aberystwythensis]
MSGRWWLSALLWSALSGVARAEDVPSVDGGVEQGVSAPSVTDAPAAKEASAAMPGQVSSPAGDAAPSSQPVHGAPADPPTPDAAATAEAAPTKSSQAVDASLPVEEPPALQTVVTGSRTQERLRETPVATEVITRAEIVASGARDASELLNARPGFVVQQGFSGAGLSMQGLAPEYVLVLVDGERVTGKVDGNVDLSRLSLEDIEQVEIVKGPGSVLYGSDAVAGVVNFITRRAQRTLGADLRAAYGTLGRLDLDATGETRGDAWGLRMSAGLQRRSAYDLDATDIGTTGSTLNGYDLSARGDWRGPGAMSLEGTASYSHRIQRGVDLGAAGAVFDRATRDNTFASRVSPSWQLGEKVTLRTDLSYGHYERRYLRDQRNASALDTVEDTRDQQARVGAQLDARPGGGHALVVGTEYLGEWLQSDRLDGGRGRRGRGSLYAQDSWTLWERVGLVAVRGGRVDVDSQFGLALTPRAALKVEPLKWLTLRGSYGWGYRAPSFQDLLIDFENPSVGYTVRGNPDLKPERSRSFSFTVETRPTRDSVVWVGLFQHSLRDMIAASLQSEGDFLRYSYVNIARARVRGGEVGLRQSLPGRVQVELGYTLTDGTDQDLDRALEGQARHRLTAQATWRHRPWNLEAHVRGALTGERPFHPDTNGDGVADSYRASPTVSLDARVAWLMPGGGLQLFVVGSNLTGAGNPTDLPIPPRTLQAGVSTRF